MAKRKSKKSAPLIKVIKSYSSDQPNLTELKTHTAEEINKAVDAAPAPFTIENDIYLITQISKGLISGTAMNSTIMRIAGFVLGWLLIFPAILSFLIIRPQNLISLMINIFFACLIALPGIIVIYRAIKKPG